MPELSQVLAFLQKSPFNMMLFGLAVTTGGMLIWPLIARTWRSVNEVGAFEAVQLINRRDALVLDVRDSGEFAAGHIANARHIPEAQLTERIKELEKYNRVPSSSATAPARAPPPSPACCANTALPRYSR